MQVKQVMSHHPHFLNPNQSLEAAAKKLAEWDSGFAPVGENDRLVGAITDRDIVIRAVAKGLDPKKELIRDHMTKNIQYCFDDEPLEKAAKMMEQEQHRRLVVLNRQKRMVGILSLGDIAAKANNQSLSGEVLLYVSKGSKKAA